MVSDYYLPDYPGTDFIRLLRKSMATRASRPFCGQPGHGELDEQRLREELSVLIMSKGCPMQELVEAVSGCLSIARSAR